MAFDLKKLKQLNDTTTKSNDEKMNKFTAKFENSINSEEFENYLQLAIEKRIKLAKKPVIYFGLPFDEENYTNILVIDMYSNASANSITPYKFRFWQDISKDSNIQTIQLILDTVNRCYDIFVDKLESLGVKVINKTPEFEFTYNKSTAYMIELEL